MAAAITYLNFDLAVERDGAAGEPAYRVRLLENQAWGQRAPHRVPRLPDEAALKLFANAIKRHRLLATLPNTLPTVEFAQPLGMELLESLLQGEIKAAYQFASQEASRKNAGLRVRLHLDHAAPELQNLPWEYVCTPPPDRRFLTTKKKWHLLRYLGQAQPNAPLRPVPTLKVLVIVGADMPEDRQHPRRPGWLAAVNGLSAALRASNYPIELHIPEVHELDEPDRFINHHGPFQAMHYLGHGKYDEDIGEGCLYFPTSAGMRRFAASDLQVLLDGQDELQLITLCACLGSRSGRDNSFSSLAARLTLTNAAAVVAMLLEIEERTAILFAKSLYTYLAEGTPVDEAVALARRALYLQKRNAEFGLPALYTRHSTPVQLLRKHKQRSELTTIKLPQDTDAPSATLAAEVSDTLLELEQLLLVPDSSPAQLQQIREDIEQFKAVEQLIRAALPPAPPRPAAGPDKPRPPHQPSQPQPAALDLGPGLVFLEGPQLIARGDRAYQQGEFAQAQACYAQALRKNPDSERGLLGLGKTLVALEQYAEAYPHLQKAVKLNPRGLEGLQQLAIVQEALGDIAGYAQTLDTILSVDADAVAARISRGRLAAQKGDHAGAASDWGHVLALFKRQPEADQEDRGAEVAWLCAQSYDQLGPTAAQAAFDAYKVVADSRSPIDPERKRVARSRMTALFNQLYGFQP